MSPCGTNRKCHSASMMSAHGGAALRCSSLVAVHLALHFGAGAGRIFPFPLLGHMGLLDKKMLAIQKVAPGGERAITSEGSLPDCGTAVVRAAFAARVAERVYEGPAFPSPAPIRSGGHRPHRLRG